MPPMNEPVTIPAPLADGLLNWITHFDSANGPIAEDHPLHLLREQLTTTETRRSSAGTRMSGYTTDGELAESILRKLVTKSDDWTVQENSACIEANYVEVTDDEVAFLLRLRDAATPPGAGA